MTACDRSTSVRVDSAYGQWNRCGVDGDSPVLPATEFGIQVETLVAMWQAFVTAAGERGTLVRKSTFTAAVLPHEVLNNALLLGPDLDAVREVRAIYPRHTRWALWTSQRETAEVALAAGLTRDTSTTAMMCTLDRLPPAPSSAIDADTDPCRVTAINGLSPEMVSEVRGVRAFVTADDTSGLLMFAHHQDVILGFVATVERARGHGLATAVVLTALHKAAAAGARTATLQATPSAVGLYARIGFVPVGDWQEWTTTGPG